DYTASLVIDDRIAARGVEAPRASALRLTLRGVGTSQRLHVTLVERDGTSWGTTIDVDSTWSERTLPLEAFRVTRGVKLPLGFPGQWNYWIDPAAGRGGPGDRIRAGEIERLQLSLRRADAGAISAGTYGVEVESATLLFSPRPPRAGP